ncbi:MAG TPA: arylsulfotransferase family protein [Thermoleophilaceae bacterium]|nr:arylsulfotransferase family protein [Thermoleophilaceae bacterium]
MRSLALALAAAAPLAAACTPALAAQVAVSPGPGTPDASPQTQISILGAPSKRIRSLSVTGALSGAHSGRLRAYSGRRGASFLLRSPLAQGERVTVVIRIRGRAPLRYSFSVARSGAAQPLLNLPVVQQSKVQHFVTLPYLIPPRITVRRGAASGSIFLTPLPSPIVHPGSNNTATISPVGPGGPMILDRRGQLVWFRQLTPPEVAANLRIQRYRGKRVLTWWQGPVTPQAFGLGEGVIADSSYRTIATVHAGNGYAMDIHEFTLTPSGDALFTVYKPVLVHLPGTPAGKLSPLLDSIVQELDIRTGLVVWEWHALGHIPLSESYATPANSASYDAFHINSIQPLTRGRVLISARDTSAIYEVDRASGRIMWRLGGKASSFRLGRGARFWFQHDAQALPGNRISLFDDEAGPPQKAPSSRGLVLKLDMKRRTARVVREFQRPGQTSAQSEGSLQTLPGGNLFAGFGAQPFFSEFSPTGRLLFDASLPQDDGSYRAYAFPWSGTPRTRPDVAVRRTGPSAVSVYASWNGATAVRRWQVLAGASAGRLSPLASASRRSFETRIGVKGSGARFAVRALGAHGRVLATSRVVTAP